MLPNGGLIILFSLSSSIRLSSCQLEFLSNLGGLFQPQALNPLSSINHNANGVDADLTGQSLKKGEACLPYIGELARLFWGNCKQQADARTWITWSKTIRDAFDSGRITLDNAVKETCRLTAEKETCETMGKRLATCDVFGVIQAAIQTSQSQQRCEKIKGFIFQPQNGVQNAGQLVGNEIVGGLVRRFLFGQ